MDNPYGSTAGAGSGEFHVYRHARAREMARMKQLDEDEVKREANAEFEKKVSGWKSEEDQRTGKRRNKRQREKEAKSRKKNMKLGGVGIEVMANTPATKTEAGEGGGGEFEYNPIYDRRKEYEVEESTGLKVLNATDTDEDSKPRAAPLGFANDGSFLDMMKKRIRGDTRCNDGAPEGISMKEKLEKGEEKKE